jgi:protein CpxP
MKKTILLLIACFVYHTGLHAQQKKAKQPSPEVRAERRTEYLKSKLVLTDAQYSKVYELILQNEKTKTADQAKTKEQRSSIDKQMKAILSPEQQEKYEAMKEDRKEKVKANMEKDRTNHKTEQEKSTNDVPKD